MNPTSTIVRGILNPDGTLQLDELPSIPAGRVEVTIRALPGQDRAEDLWQYMQRTRAELEATGRGFRTKEQIDADLEEGRDWDDQIEGVHRQVEVGRRSTGHE